jgi:hypothetical protein
VEKERLGLVSGSSFAGAKGKRGAASKKRLLFFSLCPLSHFLDGSTRRFVFVLRFFPLFFSVFLLTLLTDGRGPFCSS